MLRKSVLAAAASLASLWACESTELTQPPAADGNSDAGSSLPQEAQDSGGTSGKPLYAFESVLFNDQTQTTHVAFLPSLDARATVTLDASREFAGVVWASASEGKVIVGDGDKPQLTRYAIAEDGAWAQEQTLSFSNFLSQSLEPLIYGSPTVAYAAFDRTNHVAWNPHDFSIIGPMTAPVAIPLTRGAFTINRGYVHVVSGDYAYQPYYWADAKYSQWSPASQVAVIDVKKNEVANVVDAPCPYFHISTKDDEGNVYFSNGFQSVVPALLDSAQPKNCVVRIKAGEKTLDPSFALNFRDLAEGREGSNFFSLPDGKGFFNVYHAERDGVTMFTDPQKMLNSSNYHLWTVDLKTMKAAMMEGVDFHGGQTVAHRIDNRTYVTIPKGDYSGTALYEVLPSGKAEKRFDMQGWVFNVFRVR